MLDEKTANEKAVDDKDAVDVKDVKKEQKQKNEIKSYDINMMILIMK